MNNKFIVLNIDNIDNITSYPDQSSLLITEILKSKTCLREIILYNCIIKRIDDCFYICCKMNNIIYTNRFYDIDKLDINLYTKQVLTLKFQMI